MTRQREIAEEMRKQFGCNALNISQVGRYLGIKDYHNSKRFLEGIPSIKINNSKKYLITDIAKKLAENTAY